MPRRTRLDLPTIDCLLAFESAARQGARGHRRGAGGDRLPAGCLAACRSCRFWMRSGTRWARRRRSRFGSAGTIPKPTWRSAGMARRKCRRWWRRSVRCARRATRRSTRTGWTSRNPASSCRRRRSSAGTGGNTARPRSCRSGSGSLFPRSPNPDCARRSRPGGSNAADRVNGVRPSSTARPVPPRAEPEDRVRQRCRVHSARVTYRSFVG